MRGPGRESRLSRAPDAVPAPAEATPTAVGGYERCFAILVPRPGPVRTEPNEGFIWALLGSNHRCCPRAVVVDEPLNFPIEELEIQIDWLRRPVGDADTHQLGEDRPKGCEGTLVDGRGEPRGSRPQPMTSICPLRARGRGFLPVFGSDLESVLSLGQVLDFLRRGARLEFASYRACIRKPSPSRWSEKAEREPRIFRFCSEVLVSNCRLGRVILRRTTHWAFPLGQGTGRTLILRLVAKSIAVVVRLELRRDVQSIAKIRTLEQGFATDGIRRLKPSLGLACDTFDTPTRAVIWRRTSTDQQPYGVPASNREADRKFIERELNLSSGGALTDESEETQYQHVDGGP